MTSLTTRAGRAVRRLAGALALGLAATMIICVAPAAAQAPAVTNLAHLDFLLDEVAPAAVPGHTTYRLASEPELIMPWTYADARPGGAFQRIGGGAFDSVSGHYGQGAFNTDDIARAAVVYLRHWRQTGDRSSRQHAYQLLRSVGFMQTSSGPNAGNAVLWIQSDGELNPSADPPELPDPSDSGPSYWLARTVWAYGEGYAAFRGSDPEFARFLQARLRLALDALNRQVLFRYGRYQVVDGARLPAWLIIDGADASAEAVLGLSAYVDAVPGDRPARRALGQLAAGIAAMQAGDRDSWPYGAILPWAKSRSVWHAWGSQMAAALARSSATLDRPVLLRPAVNEMVGFEPTLLGAGGPDNGWQPTPTDRTQIAYGADSRLQDLLAVTDVTGLRSARDLAALAGAWYFGANRSGQPVYDPGTGVTFDGVQADGTINRNSGAESTIHGLLSMLALDAHPQVRDRARTVTTVQGRTGLRLVEAEDATSTTGAVVTPESGWTGESLYSGQTLVLDRGDRASIAIGSSPWPLLVEPVSWLDERGDARSVWRQRDRPLGVLRHRVGAQGVSEVPGALLPQDLARPASPADREVTVRVTGGTVTLDALLVRPLISALTLSGPGGGTQLLQSAAGTVRTTTVGFAGERSTIRGYDRQGRLVLTRVVSGRVPIGVPAGGMVVVER